MPSTKTRINLTVPSAVEQQLVRIAKRDDQSVSFAALELLKRALDIEEDAALLHVVKARDQKRSVWMSHARAWK